ncbi:MAG: hypothetical protein J4F35_17860 [Candidatus Latescibacteria bacterium]|nr:hypothetical protein [Candidatus Latescibacterota bacterium]
MVFSKVLCVALVVALLLAQGEPAEATPESRAGALFLLISPSVRVNGMGQAGVALLDEPAGYYNPGAAALASPAHTLQSRFYLSGMPWLPALADDISYNYFAAQAAAERVFDGFLGLDKPTKLRVAFYGYRTKLDLGEQLRTNERGEVIGTFNDADASNNIGVSLALRSVVELGIGATSKQISSNLGGRKGSAEAYDFGLMAIVPVVGVWERLTGREFILIQHLRPKLDVGLGVTWQNRGDKTIRYTDILFADPLPANRRHGWSGSLGMDWNSDSFNLAIGRVTFSKETYRPQVDGAHVTSLAEDDKSGFEVSIMETVAVRRGTYDDFDGEVHLKTSGWTVKSDGLFKFFAHQLDSTPSNSEDGALQFLARHLSISWSRFEYGDRSSSLFRGVGHSFIGLSF